MTAQLYPTGTELLLAAETEAARIHYVGLFQNPAVLSKGFDPAILTEANFSGYGKINLGGLWGAASIDVNGNGTCVCPQQTFTKGGATPNPFVYGLSYWDVTGLICLHAQIFVDGPYPMVIDGDVIRVTPLLSIAAPIFP